MSGDPSGGRQMPSRERTFGWLKSFMMIPSFRNWDTSSKSVMPVEKKKVFLPPTDLTSFLR